MPIFEYVCIKCDNRFEKLQKTGTTGDSYCPRCGSAEVEKQLSAFSSAAASSPTACSSGG